MKIIASSVRKGNILEVDGQLYSVLSAESFFPGKGTPTTQIEMRRLSDAVKTPAGTFEECVTTKETTPLEAAEETKSYAPGIGLVRDANLRLVRHGRAK